MTTLHDHDTGELDGLEAHLRHVLHEVARHAAAPAPARLAPTTGTAGPRRRRRVAVAGVVAAVTLGGIAAWGTLGDGEIDRIPVEAALQAGTAEDGSQWWMFATSDVLDSCAGRSPGVVLVTSDRNRLGSEWDMMGVAYGEPPTSDVACSPHDEAAWLDDPARAGLGRTRVGDGDDDGSDWGYLAAVHPDVVAIEVAAAGTVRTIDTEPLPEAPDGARYAAFTLPADQEPAEVRIVLVLADGTRTEPRS